MKLSLDLTALSPEDASAWQAYVRFAASSAGVHAKIELAADPPSAAERFALVSGSGVLSRKLLRQFERIHVVPSAPLVSIDVHLYWGLVASERLPDDASARGLDRLRPAFKRVTLLSSVYDGDEYLPGFLENSARLEQYEDCEHFLIRAGSPGREHEALVRHVRAHPAAVYINLDQDPGLYEVWNLGARLSTARYLSSANIDDRRAPAHVRRLASVLDENPGIDVVSSTLRISETRNLSWEDASDCPVMFRTGEDRTYQADELIQGKAGVVRSRNLPHCMPLWRRELHAFHGYFDESRYGPSADWAFWLHAGIHGATFHLVAEPLGLYLKDAASYWRRSGETGAFDRRILKEYGNAVGAIGAANGEAARPLGPGINDALTLLRGSACFEGLAGLFRCIERARDEEGETIKALIAKAGEIWLARDDLADARLEEGCNEQALERFFDRLVTVVHGLPVTDGTEVRFDRARDLLLFACADLQEISRDRRWPLLRALILGKFGAPREEQHLLERLHREAPGGFWVAIQSVYRFATDLGHLTSLVSDLRTAQEEDVPDRSNLNIVYYPAYTQNTYQTLLYRPVIEAGGAAQGIRDLSELEQMRPAASARNVFHVHWINAIFKKPGPEGFSGRAKQFLSRLRALREQGFAIYWTVHNNVSHETPDRHQEMAFRRALYEHADRVYLHHPMVAELLEWLPDREKLYLVEHGPYDLVAQPPVSRDEARRKLGLDAGDFLLAYIGQIREYKALEEILPRILEILEQNPRMKLMMVGRIRSAPVEDMLRDRLHDRILLREEHLSGEELEICMRAADFGFLSYREILTSGALFHWASCGIPIIGPKLGTIPAYLVPGWNGFVYRDGAHLREILKGCLGLSREEVGKLGRNARRMADSLRWEFF